MKNNILLLKTLLLSTSQRNIYKHTDDAKKKKRIVSGFIGSAIIYIMIMVYSVSMCVGYGQNGLIEAAPVMCALTVSILAFVLTLLRTNGYLFNFKEYDMLMSLPFEARTVAGCKFLYMYVKSLPWYISISFAMLAGYGFFAKPSILAYIVWIVLTFLLPIIPMLVASFIGFLIARVSAGFRKTNIVQTVLTIVFVLFCFSLRYIVDGMFKNDKVEQTLQSIAKITESATKYYLPAGWFSNAVTKLSLTDLFLFLGVSAVLFATVFIIVGRSYRNINSALKSHAAAKRYKMADQKEKSVVNAIAFKEFKRMTGSTTYMVNAAMGEILAFLLGVITLVIGFNKIVAIVTNNAPFDAAILQPAIPFIVYFFIGMMATTAASPSLEGKNYWIMQSLPIEKKTMYQGKMLFNMYLTVPFMLFATLCLCISAKVPTINTLLYLILGTALCAFSTAWGCVCGVRHIRLDWENEVEVIKQGAAVTVYLLPNMFVVMGLCALTVFLGTKIDHRIIAIVFILITTTLAALSYRRVMKFSK
ncbi:MAG: hypothetical protein IJ077_05200 [Eubacterium sp.]|nr:hypothetical protein [Eubacterium sp.]